MNEEGIKKLAQLSRLELTESEVAEYAGEFSEILSYIDTLKEAVDSTEGKGDLILENSISRNVMREDENPHQSGINTDRILESAPNSEKNYIKVKKVL